VWDFQFVGNRNEFTAIPVAGSFLHGKPVGNQGYGKHSPANDVIFLLKVWIHESGLKLRGEDSKNSYRLTVV
jgi:hypothetical protein